MKKKWLTVVCFVLLLVLLTGCTSSKSYTFSVETGDSVLVKLDTTGGYALSQSDGSFAVSKDETVILQGIFLTRSTYDAYYAAVTQEEGVEILGQGTMNGNDCIFYTVQGEAGAEADFLVWVTDTETGVLLASLRDAELALESFNRLTLAKA